MTPQENINNMMTKMTAVLETVRECEILILEEIRKIEQLQEEKVQLSEQIAALNEKLSLVQKNIEEIKVQKVSEIVDEDKEPEVVAIPTPVVDILTVAPEKHSIETLADKFHGQPSVHDKIAAKPEVTTTGTRVNDIAKAISINDRLLFIKELFGKAEIFTQTVKYLNGLQSFDEAQQYLAEAFPHWDNTGSTAQLFLSIIHRRYL
ncbi:MAG: hypothetical protein LBH91_00220 [Prevotellaceae bacterium]|jgi:hypothetical protein|nr:hypothetical protein [Prevotellaceae bacterium]